MLSSSVTVRPGQKQAEDPVVIVLIEGSEGQAEFWMTPLMAENLRNRLTAVLNLIPAELPI